MPRKPASIRNRQKVLKRYEKQKRSQDVVPQQAASSEPPDSISTSVPADAQPAASTQGPHSSSQPPPVSTGEDIDTLSTKEYGENVKSKVEERKRLLAQVVPPVATPEKKETDLSNPQW